jgi:hypothetical protein
MMVIIHISDDVPVLRREHGLKLHESQSIEECFEFETHSRVAHTEDLTAPIIACVDELI